MLPERLLLTATVLLDAWKRTPWTVINKEICICVEDAYMMCDLFIYRVAGVVKDAVFYMSIRPIINVCSTIISWEASENCCSRWCELDKNMQGKKKSQQL